MDVRSGERGSVMPLLIGLLALVALTAGVVVNISSLYLHQRALYQLADSAALTAVTRLDLDRYYQSGARSSVPTMDEEVLVQAVIARSQLTRARIERLERSDGEVALTLALDLPLPWPFLLSSTTVRAHVRAQASP